MKFFCLSPESVPMNQVLFPTFVQTFWAAGHEFTVNIKEADIVLFDLHTRIAPYKQSDIDWLSANFIPVATFDEWDRGSMSNDEWPNPLTLQQEQIFGYLDGGRKMVHFCRLLDKTKTYPENLYPYEKPYSYIEPPLSPDELFDRPFDIAYIANDAPNRRRIAEALAADRRLKCDILLGAKKLEFPEFLARHKRAKFFISSAAGGYTDERVQCLFSVAAIIRQRTDQLLLHDFGHGENCLRIDSPPTKQDLDTIVEAANNKELLYYIYTKGINFVKTYYSAEYIAKDILGKIEKHLCQK